MNETHEQQTKGGTSASNASYDLLCEGRHLAQLGLPEISGPAADFGNAIHEALKTGDASKLTPQQLNIYESCVEIENDVTQQIFRESADRVAVVREQRYWVNLKEGYLHSGQLDVVKRFGPTILICDYKSLAGDVQESPMNQQLRDQAVLAARNLIGSEVYVCIIQPLVTHKPELCRYDSNSLAKAEQEMFERVRRSNNPNAQRTPGELQCKYCRASATCQPHLNWRAAMFPEKLPFDVAHTAWTPEQRALVASRLEAMQSLVDGVREFLKQCLNDDPDSVPGFYLKPGAILHPVTDPEVLFTRFTELGGALDQFMKCVNIQKGVLETQVREVTKLKGKELNSAINKLLDGITTAKQNQPSIAKRKENK